MRRHHIDWKTEGPCWCDPLIIERDDSTALVIHLEGDSAEGEIESAAEVVLVGREEGQAEKGHSPQAFTKRKSVQEAPGQG